MIVYFADRSMDILGLASTGLPEGFLLTNDNKTEDIDSGVAVFEAEINYTDDTHVEAKALTAVGNFLLRQNGDLYEAYTIIEREDDNLAGSIYVYAEDAGLDLLNSIAEAYTATEAHPIAWYVDKWAASSGFAVGINEIPNLTRTLSWDADATATERIRSVANQFDNAEIGYSFSVRNFRITGKFIDIYKHRGKDIAQELRMGREVGSIVEKSSIAELATALKVTGGTPAPTDADPSPQPITLEGYSYDDGDFYTDGQFLRSREALKTWGRYRTDGIIAVNSNITKTYTYDTTSQSELCSRSITQLTKLREPEVNYEVSLLYLPDNLVVGDTVRIVDDKGELYLSARLLKLEVSISNETRVATFGDFLIKSSGVSARIDALADEFSRIQQARTLYTWKVYADDASGTGISTDSTGKAYIGLATNKLSQTPDLTDPTLYTWSKIEGDPGATGPAGPTGPTGPQGESATIVSQSVSYCLSDSGTDPGSIERCTEDSIIRVLEDGEVRELELAVAPWRSTVPAYEPNTYLWTKTTIVYSDGTVIDSYSVSYNQPKVESVVSEYYLSTSNTTQSGGSWSETPAEYINGRYYWRRDKTTWNDGTIEYSDPVLDQSMISANENASTALTNANNALTTANGKNKVYHQSTAPTGATFVVGDTWFDTDDGYKMYTYDGSSWVAEEFGTNAISDLAITNAKIADATIQNAKIATVDAGKITTGTLDADRIAANSIVIGKLSSEVQGSIEKIDNLEVGGRNLARNTGDMTPSDWVFNRSTLTSTVLTMTPTTSAANAKYKINYLAYGDYRDNYFTISFDCRELATGSYGTGAIRVCLMVQLASRLNSLVGSASDRFQTFDLASQGTEWHRYTLTKKIPDDLQTGQESALVDSSFVTFQFIRNASTRPIEIKNIKFELGTVATDWTPAPEDVNADIDDARKTATSYISTDSTGIMVADMENGVQTPSAATGRNVRVTSTAVEVRDGQDVKASFGTEVVLGDTNESKLRLGDKYVRAQDSDDNIYYEVQDLRGENITAIFYGTELHEVGDLGWMCSLYWASEIVSVTVDGVATQNYTLESDGSILWLQDDPADGIVTIVYKTEHTSPAFTFGTRNSEEQGIFSAAFGEDNEASGRGSFASGMMSQASGEYSTAEGVSSIANGFASHAHGFGATAPNDYETAIGRFNKAVASPHGASTIAFYIGNGDNSSDTHNALTVDFQGNIETNEVQSILSKLSNDLSGVDLNDVTEPGNYSVAASTAISNTPFSTNPAGATSPAFSLMVFNSRIVTSGTSETVVLQVAWSKDAGAVRARIYQSLTWSAWQTLMATTQPTFSRNTTNTSAATVDIERVGDMVVGSGRVTVKAMTAGTSYAIGTVNPPPPQNSVVFARRGANMNVQGWIGSSGAMNLQSASAVSAGQNMDIMFVYKASH